MSTNLSKPRARMVWALPAGIVVTAALFALLYKLWLIVLLSVVSIVAILAGYVAIVKVLKKRRADPFERELREAGGAVPASSDAASRAQLDQMRKKFDDGLTTFRDRGKDPYSLPWYVIIGEPGSGKTEAIRHCGIGFPPGLQDELQGTGGTVNMDWWFTNHAVILDTAGRLTFGDVAATDSKEWREFLQLLRKHRYNCPINGLLIAIPIDSLVQDSADVIDQKGGRLARQLDLIQSTLGVRFPVVILVTKSDMLLGFREFFKNVRDPAMQGQILGWSNPLPIDQPFEPAAVTDSMKQIRSRLTKRRMGLVLDPVHTSDSDAMRTEEVDELYAFPEALDRITTRLQRYLEKVFVAGEWASKPLFLRGIYFTSSMQQGEALDAELADALGVDVTSLEGGGYTEDRAFFLHDVFTKKVFREAGLVTRAGNTVAQQRHRRHILLGSGLLTFLVLSAIIFVAVQGYRSTIGDQQEFWAGVADLYEESWDDDVARNDWTIVGKKPDTDEYYYKELNSRSMAALLTEARRSAASPLNEHFILRPFSMLAGQSKGLTVERLEACREIVERGVIRPLVAMTTDRLADTSGAEWSGDATDALVQLADILAFSGQNRARPAALEERPFDVLALVRFLLDDAYAADPSRKETIDTEVAQVQEVVNWLYADPGAGALDGGAPAGMPWAPSGLVDVRDLLDALDAFAAHWVDQGREAKTLDALENLVTSLEQFDEAELELLETRCVEQGFQAADIVAVRREWTNAHETLNGRHSALAAHIGGLDELAPDWSAKGLVDTWVSVTDDARTTARDAFGRLYAAAAGKEEARIDRTSASDFDDGNRDGAEAGSDDVAAARHARRFANTLVTKWKEFEAAFDERVEARGERLQALDQLMLARADDESPLRTYEARCNMYRIAAEGLVAPPPQGAEFGMLAAAFEAIGANIRASEQDIQAIALENAPTRPRPAADRFALAKERSLCVARVLSTYEPKLAMLGDFFDRCRPFERPGAIADEVRRRGARSTALPGARLPLSDLAENGFDRGFDHRFATPILLDWQTVCNELQGAIAYPGDIVDSYERLRSPVEDFTLKYAEYWTTGIIEQLHVVPQDWESLFTELEDAVDEGTIEDQLRGLRETVAKATEPLQGDRLNCLSDLRADARAEIDALLDEKGDDDLLDVIDEWVELGADAAEARGRFLSDAGRRRFESRYFLDPDAGPYAYGLPLLLLEALTNAATSIAEEAYENLREMAGFPLPPAPDGQPARNHLEPARVDDALGEIERASLPADLPRLPRDVEESIEMMMAPLDADKNEWLSDCEAMLKALPRTSAPARRVRVSVVERGSREVSEFWREIGFSQGRELGRKRRMDEEFSLDCPGGDVSLDFYQTLANRPDRVTLLNRRSGETRPVFQGPWALLWMLYDCGARPSGNGRTWTVDLTVRGDAPTNRRMELRLEFDPPIPPFLADYE